MPGRATALLRDVQATGTERRGLRCVERFDTVRQARGYVGHPDGSREHMPWQPVQIAAVVLTPTIGNHWIRIVAAATAPSPPCSPAAVCIPSRLGSDPTGARRTCPGAKLTGARASGWRSAARVRGVATTRLRLRSRRAPRAPAGAKAGRSRPHSRDATSRRSRRRRALRPATRVTSTARHAARPRGREARGRRRCCSRQGAM